MEGIFLKHLFCSAVPLKAFIVFMAAIDFFMVIVDCLTLYTRARCIHLSLDENLKIAVTLSIIFFAIRILAYIPMAFFTLRLLLYSSKTGGKVLYGLKLSVFLIFAAFNIIGGFLSNDGCSMMHTQIRSD
jgi:hypothetical protein